MTDTTQPQAGRALDKKMAKAVGWKVYEKEDCAQGWDNLSAEYPCMILGEYENDYSIMRSEYDISNPVLWQPSTRIADAFEVMSSHEGFEWNTSETAQVDYLRIELSANDSFYVGLFIPWADFTDPDGTRNRPEAYAFGICWAALVWLEGQEKTEQEERKEKR